MARKLKDIDVDEISLVDAGAVRKKFFIKKRRSLMDLIEILKDFLGEDTELTEDELKKAKNLSDKAAKAISSALNMLNKYKDDMPSDVLTAIKTLGKYASYGYPAQKAEEVDILGEMTNVEKAGARLSKATIEQLKKIAEIINGLIGAAEDKVKKAAGDIDTDKLPDHIVAKLEKLQKIEEAEDLKKQQEKDKIITDLLAEVKNQGDLIKKMAKGEPISKQLEDDPESDELGEEDKAKAKVKKMKTKFTKEELAAMPLEEKRKYADAGVLDLWPSIDFGTEGRDN